MKPSKAMIAGAAVAGLLTGSFAVRAYAASTSGHAGVAIQTMADAEKGKHACKGQNECKGQGGCKTSDGGCKAKNSCKGKGGCATDGTKPPTIWSQSARVLESWKYRRPEEPFGGGTTEVSLRASEVKYDCSPAA